MLSDSKNRLSNATVQITTKILLSPRPPAQRAASPASSSEVPAQRDKSLAQRAASPASSSETYPVV